MGTFAATWPQARWLGWPYEMNATSQGVLLVERRRSEAIQAAGRVVEHPTDLTTTANQKGTLPCQLLQL